MMLPLSRSASPLYLMASINIYVVNNFSTNQSGSLESAFLPENVKAGVRATSDPGPDDTVKAIGWGKAGSNMEAFKTLHEVEIKVHKTEKPQDRICIDSEGGHGVCNGDSGGPLLDSNGHVTGIGK